MDVIFPLKRDNMSTARIIHHIEHKSIKSFISPSLAGGIVGGGSVVGGSVGA